MNIAIKSRGARSKSKEGRSQIREMIKRSTSMPRAMSNLPDINSTGASELNPIIVLPHAEPLTEVLLKKHQNLINLFNE